jgi:hypothetical protein
MSKPQVLNQVNILFLIVHVFFLLGLTYTIQYGTIHWLTSYIDYIVPFAP